MASRYGKNPIKGTPKKAKALTEEQKVAKSRQRGKTNAKTGATVVTRDKPTNARGGNKPLKGGTATQAKSTKDYLKRIKAARSKDAAAKASKSAIAAGVGKAAVKTAIRAVPVVGTAIMAKDIYDLATKDGKRTSKGGQMSRTKKKGTK